MATVDRYPVTQKYLMTRNQALNFPIDFFKGNFRKNDVYGVVIDLPMPNNVLSTMVCFINGAANLYFNNGGEYTGASQKYRGLVLAAHNLVVASNALLPKCEKTTMFDLPRSRVHNVFLLTKSGVYKAEFAPGLIPETEPEKRSVYVLYQKVLGELRNCQLKDELESRNGNK